MKCRIQQLLKTRTFRSGNVLLYYLLAGLPAEGGQAGKTNLIWRMLFETAAEYDRVKAFAVEGNKQNLDHLDAHLAKIV